MVIEPVRLKKKYLSDNPRPFIEAINKYRHILVALSTGHGKTSIFIRELKNILEILGVKHIILAVPTQDIVRSFEAELEPYMDGKRHNKESDYPEIYISTYDNLTILPDGMLSKSLTVLDEIHKFFFTDFMVERRTAAWERLREHRVVAMSGTVHHELYEEAFDYFLDITPPEEHRQKVTVRRVECDNTNVPVFLNRLPIPEGSPQINFIENKKTIIKLTKDDPAAVDSFSFESRDLYHPCKGSVGRGMIKAGKFPKGVNILNTTSGADAGWSLYVGGGTAYVCIAGMNKNIANIMAVAQEWARIRDAAEVVVFVMDHIGSKVERDPEANYAASVYYRREEIRHMSKRAKANLRGIETVADTEWGHIAMLTQAYLRIQNMESKLEYWERHYNAVIGEPVLLEEEEEAPEVEPRDPNDSRKLLFDTIKGQMELGWDAMKAKAMLEEIEVGDEMWDKMAVMLRDEVFPVIKAHNINFTAFSCAVYDLESVYEPDELEQCMENNDYNPITAWRKLHTYIDAVYANGKEIKKMKKWVMAEEWWTPRQLRGLAKKLSYVDSREQHKRTRNEAKGADILADWFYYETKNFGGAFSNDPDIRYKVLGYRHDGLVKTAFSSYYSEDRQKRRHLIEEFFCAKNARKMKK